MRALLDEPIELAWRPEPDRIEVDLAKQVLYVVEDREVVAIVPVSSGNGARYASEAGTLDEATTPEGSYRFQRQNRGMRVAFLGEIYNPFYRGYAIYGSPIVPCYPASHGCIRVTMWDMDMLVDRFEVGQAVYIYGKNTKIPPPGLRPEAEHLI
jgi:N-acetylmuramoyl-L-alanine amidase